MTQTHKSLWALSLTLLAALICSCSSTVGLGDKEKTGYAHIEIQGSTELIVRAATIKVFTEEDFSVISKRADVVRFSKEGTTSTSIFYGTSFTEERMTIEPELTIVPNKAGTGYNLHCEVYIMEHASDGKTKQNWRLIKNGHRAYMKLLEEIKNLSESPATSEGTATTTP